jgi:hypothetical protein
VIRGDTNGHRESREMEQRSCLRPPSQIARAVGLRAGEGIKIDARDGDLLIRHPHVNIRGDAKVASEEIIAEAVDCRLDALSARLSDAESDPRRGTRGRNASRTWRVAAASLMSITWT